MDNENHWHNKVKYIRNVCGEDIVKEQNKINSGKDQFVVATQIFPVVMNTVQLSIYDAFIYYKTKYDVV